MISIIMMMTMMTVIIIIMHIFLQPGGLESILEITFHTNLVKKMFSLEIYLATVVVAGCWKGKM